MAGCVLCHVEDDGDLRTLRIGCLYDLREASPLFEPVKATIEGVDHPQTLWTMRICKDCRATFIRNLRHFVDTALEQRVSREIDEETDPERNIPVRVDGTTVMMTEGEYAVWRLHD